MASEEDVSTNALQSEQTPTPENLDNTQVPEKPVEANLETNPGPTPEPAPNPEHGNKGKTPWYMERIHEETNKRRGIEEQLAAERREKEEFKALVERLQSGDKEPLPAARREEAQPDIDALVDARAARKLFDADCNDVANAWRSESAAFGDRLAILQGAGVMPARDGSNTDFLMDVIAVDKANAHKILDSLASDPDRAIALSRMDSRRRVAELTRMTMAEAPKPAPKANVSKVPPPKPQMDAMSDGVGDMDLANDKISDSDWSRLFDKKFKKTA